TRCNTNGSTTTTDNFALKSGRAQSIPDQRLRRLNLSIRPSTCEDRLVKKKSSPQIALISQIKDQRPGRPFKAGRQQKLIREICVICGLAFLSGSLCTCSKSAHINAKSWLNSPTKCGSS